MHIHFDHQHKSHTKAGKIKKKDKNTQSKIHNEGSDSDDTPSPREPTETLEVNPTQRRASDTRVKPLPKVPIISTVHTDNTKEKSPRIFPPLAPSPRHNSTEAPSDNPYSDFDKPIREMPTEELKNFSEMLGNISSIPLKALPSRPLSLSSGEIVDSESESESSSGSKPNIFGLYLEQISSHQHNPENPQEPITTKSAEYSEYKSLMANVHGMNIKLSPRNKSPRKESTDDEHSPFTIVAEGEPTG